MTQKNLFFIALFSVLSCGSDPKTSEPVINQNNGNNTNNQNNSNNQNNANNANNINNQNNVKESCQAGSDVFDETRVHQIAIQLDDADWEAMHVEKAESPEYGGPPKTYFAATMTIDGETLPEPVGFRLKGHYSLVTAEGHRYPLKVDFNRIADTQKFQGLGKLNLHPSGEENRSAFNEYLSYGSLRAHGIPTARTAFAKMMVNGEDLGLYNLVEQIDGRFVKCHFDEPYGQLYKPEEGNGNLEFAGERFSDYPTVEHKWPKAEDHTSFLNMVEVINTGDLDRFPDVLDMTGVLTFFAANTGVGSPDHYASTGHNYYLYENSPGRFTMIPWDLNISQFAVDDPCGIPGRNDASFPLSFYPLGDEGYVNEYKELLLGFLDGPGRSRLSRNASKLHERCWNLRTKTRMSLTNSSLSLRAAWMAC